MLSINFRANQSSHWLALRSSKETSFAIGSWNNQTLRHLWWIIWTGEKTFCLSQKPHKQNDGTCSSENLHEIEESNNRKSVMMKKLWFLLPLPMANLSIASFWWWKWQKRCCQWHLLSSSTQWGSIAHLSFLSNSKKVLVDARRPPGTLHNRSHRVSYKKKLGAKSVHEWSASGSISDGLLTRPISIRWISIFGHCAKGESKQQNHLPLLAAVIDVKQCASESTEDGLKDVTLDVRERLGSL